MRPVDIFRPFRETLAPFKRGIVVYRLTWGDSHYIGSSKNIYSRVDWWCRHFTAEGVSAVKIKVLIVCNEADRFVYEEQCIRVLKPGHNKTVTGKGGGVLGKPCTEETKRKIGARRLGFRFTEETKAKMSEAAKRRGTHSAESIAKAAERNRGKVRTAEMRAVLSAASKGKPKSEAHKAALKAAWIRRKQSGR